MPTLTTAQVRTLLTPPAPPCVSIYLPTHRGEPDRREDPIRYRGLVRQAEDKLRAALPGGRVQELVRKFDQLADDVPFWAGALDGLAVFGAGDFFQSHRLPRPVAERVTVADSFHIKPLLRVTQSADRFHVLGLTRIEARLYVGDRYGLQPIPDALPTYDDAVRTDRPRPPREAMNRGDRPAHAAGHPAEQAGKVEIHANAEEYFRVIRTAVLDRFSNPTGLPLVLVALPDNAAEFLKHAQNPHLLPDYVPHDPGSRSLDQLRAEAWKVVEPKYLARLARLTEDFGTAASRGKGSGLPAEVAAAARDGRVGVLLVDADTTIPGRLDAATGAVRADATGDDLLDDLAELTLKTGGDVVVVPHDKMPTDTGVAAIYRF